jgi:hypothetical protein
MIYLDKMGSWLNVNFSLASTKKSKIKRKTYKKNFGSYDSVANTYGWNTYDRGKTHLSSDITDSFTIQTDYVNEDIGQQVIDMIESSEVYHLTEETFERQERAIVANPSGYQNAGGFERFLLTTNSDIQAGDIIEIVGISPAIDGVKVVTQVVGPGADIRCNTPFTGIAVVPPGAKVYGDVSISGGELRAVNITSNSVTEKTRLKDKLIQYKVNFEYSSKNGVQRG